MPEVINNHTPNERFWIAIKFAILISIVEACSQANLKSNKYIFCGFLGYIGISFLLYQSYKYEGMGHMNLLWSCISIILAYLFGYIFFKEDLNKYTFIAIFFALVAIYFAHQSDESAP